MTASSQKKLSESRVINDLGTTACDEFDETVVFSAKKRSEKWIRKEKIGQGAQGSVYRCVDIKSGREVAVKIIDTLGTSPSQIENIKEEVKIIKQLRHSCLVQYHKIKQEKKKKQLRIYMEYGAGGALSCKIRRDGPILLPTLRTFTRQILRGLQFLHRNGIAHRDVKCANIFLSRDCQNIKLGDFGAYKVFGSASLVGGLKGTPHWMAPEVIREQCTTEDAWIKADVWSLGCTVLEMYTGHSPWQEYSNPMAAMYQIVTSDQIPSIPSLAPEDLFEFLQKCLHREPSKRFTTTGLLQLPFVKNTIRKMTDQLLQNAGNEPDNLSPVDAKRAAKSFSTECLEEEGDYGVSEIEEPEQGERNSIRVLPPIGRIITSSDFVSAMSQLHHDSSVNTVCTRAVTAPIASIPKFVDRRYSGRTQAKLPPLFRVRREGLS
uniref:Mitogenactivated protein kinase kinase kinase putati n=1 Tax=Albugo laibachii Nc14 TaxID=890382 RepID=F0WEM3_9STRA|nr:mitogenactivated protein kinase kinase kinase putati [Albugo laibachii Nc14]CCA23087.1 mitogenactivated protein kinase kinase kinase putati [Albugo laibachii Nc14]|eukprot:CCA23087.1 mitogenactivated protein kinase kinase kinase putati [Albugo laibachii Nc14]